MSVTTSTHETTKQTQIDKLEQEPDDSVNKYRILRDELIQFVTRNQGKNQKNGIVCHHDSKNLKWTKCE